MNSADRTRGDTLAEAIEMAMIGAFVDGFDRRARVLRADGGGDAAAHSHRARTAALLEACASDVRALVGPILPAQGRLALPSPDLAADLAPDFAGTP